MATPTMRERWDALSPPRKKQAVSLLVIVGILVFSSLILSSGVVDKRTRPGSSRISNELIPTEATRDLGISGVASDVERLSANLRAKDDRITNLERSLNQLSGRPPGAGVSGIDPATAEELKRLRNEVSDLRDVLDSGRAPERAAQPSTSARPTRTRAGSQTMGPPPSTGNGAGSAPTSGTYARAPARVSAGPIRTISESDDAGNGAGNSKSVPAAMMSRDGSKTADEVPTSYVPSGSMMTGVVITGLDAPTGKGAMKDPIPVLVRIKHEAILPNRYRADVKECFLLASGHGDLASERAYLRAVSISCIRHDKKVIDIKVEMYAVGSDGKAGVRGRLVSKQGQVIAKAALAGLAQGFSQAFSGTRYRLNYNDVNNSPDYGTAAQAGLGSGVGSAFDRIAKYYLDLADQVFPVIEIDAGQKITFVMVKGASMGTLK